MVSPLLTAFILQLIIHLINTVGKQTINDTLWTLFSKLPTAHSQEAAQLSKQRREVVRLNREMNATSAQDEFAKWAKLRRQHDKAKDQYDAAARSQKSTRQTFDRITSALRFLGTQGLQFGCNMWYGKQAMFWLPRGWMPYPAEWILSFPRAPVGGISVNVWAIACACVIGLVSEAIMALWGLMGSGKVKEGEKIAMESSAPPPPPPVASGKTKKSTGREKKEL